MDIQISEDRIRGWLDTDLIDSVERLSDSAAEFNILLEMSGLEIHVLRRRPDGPILVGQEIEYDEGIQNQIRGLSQMNRDEAVARIRETLTSVPVIYGFTNAEGENVPFEQMGRIFLESRIYPDQLSQGLLMERLLDIWKVMRYLDDLPRLLASIKGRSLSHD